MLRYIGGIDDRLFAHADSEAEDRLAASLQPKNLAPDEGMTGFGIFRGQVRQRNVLRPAIG